MKAGIQSLLIVVLQLLFIPTSTQEEQKAELVVQTGHTAFIKTIAFSPDGKLLASGSYDKTIKLWEMPGGNELTTLRGHTEPVTSVEFSPDSRTLVSSGEDATIRLWDVSSGHELKSLPMDPNYAKFSETMRARSISSDELSLWLRDVDAGQMTLIVDACYSTAAIEGSGFKPGPMGSRGLGQLAYDKGMRILTATQADNVAMELTATSDGRPIRHGLLSYALVEKGLASGDADFRPLDKNIFMAEWLEFGATDVPKLFALMPKPAGGVPLTELQAAAIHPSKGARLVMQRELADTGACGPVKRSALSRAQEQQPALFDFTHRGRDVLIMRKH